MKKVNLFFMLPFLWLIAVSCSEDQSIVYSSETVVYKEVENVDSNLLSLDINYSSDINTKKPVVIWVHGGGWSIGDKANKVIDKVNLMESNHWLMVSVNYRLSPFPYEVDNADRIKYPVHNNDVADAIKWVYENIDHYGGDPDKLVLLGHSAGAHLVALTGTNTSFLEERSVPLSAIKGVAVFDTEGYDVASQVEAGVNLYINAFGTDSTDLYEASPINHLEYDITYPAFFIAKRGAKERLAIANGFIDALKAQGISVDEVDGSIYSHAMINEAIGASYDATVTPPLVDFISSCVE